MNRRSTTPATRRRCWRRRCAVLPLPLVALCLPRGARAGPLEDLPVSNDAAIMGGAVRAGGRSGGSFYYNPALLGRIHVSEVEANAEVVGVRQTAAQRGAVLTRADGTRQRDELDNAEFVAVPTSLAGVSALTERLTFGYGIFQPTGSDVSLASDDRTSEEDGSETIYRLRNRAATQRLYGGVGLGYEVSKRFHVGASTFVVYDQTDRSGRVYGLSTAADGSTLTSLVDEDVSVASIGLVTAVGIRGRLARLVHGGVSLRTPVFVVDQTFEGSRLESHVGPDGADNETRGVDRSTWRQHQLTGWRVGTGLSVGDERWLVNIDVEADSGTIRREGPLGARPTVAAALGGRVSVAKSAAIGLGVHYRQSGAVDDTFGTADLDLLGASAGVELRRRLALANERGIEFRTVLAAWYAHGFGTLQGVRATAGTERALERLTTSATPATSHLFVLHIGSSLAF